MSSSVHSPSDPTGLPTGGGMPEERSLRERLALLKDKNFLKYWISGNISWFGDLFAMIAMPLLIINMTDSDAGALGTVMAVSGIPRVIFILMGGVLIDRFSAYKMVMLARILMGVTQLSLAIVAMFGMVEMWMVYVVATVGGTVGAFLFPAQMTLMPSVLDKEDLPSGNALNTTAQQVLQSFAPMVVGFLIAFLSGYDIMAAEGQKGDPAQELVAYGYAFLINAGTFVVSAYMLSRVIVRPNKPVEHHEPMLRSIWIGFEAVWLDAPLRAFILYIALSQLFMMGNIMVGQPMMATLRVEMYGLPAAAIVGLFGACSGVGAVIGSLVGGFFARPSEAFYGPMMMLIAACRGVTMLSLGFLTDLPSVLVLFGFFGLFMGYTSVFFMTWMQTRVEISLLGRMMSVMMFAMMGVAPLSAAFWGWGIDAGGLESLYYVSGIFMIVVAIGGLMSPSIRLMGYSPQQARDARHDRLAAKESLKHPAE
jgi:MFS family permease